MQNQAKQTQNAEKSFDLPGNRCKEVAALEEQNREEQTRPERIRGAMTPYQGVEEKTAEADENRGADPPSEQNVERQQKWSERKGEEHS